MATASRSDGSSKETKAARLEAIYLAQIEQARSEVILARSQPTRSPEYCNPAVGPIWDRLQAHHLTAATIQALSYPRLLSHSAYGLSYVLGLERNPEDTIAAKHGHAFMLCIDREWAVAKIGNILLCGDQDFIRVIGHRRTNQKRLLHLNQETAKLLPTAELDQSGLIKLIPAEKRSWRDDLSLNQYCCDGDDEKSQFADTYLTKVYIYLRDEPSSPSELDQDLPPAKKQKIAASSDQPDALSAATTTSDSSRLNVTATAVNKTGVTEGDAQEKLRKRSRKSGYVGLGPTARIDNDAEEEPVKGPIDVPRLEQKIKEKKAMSKSKPSIQPKKEGFKTEINPDPNAEELKKVELMKARQPYTEKLTASKVGNAKGKRVEPKAEALPASKTEKLQGEDLRKLRPSQELKVELKESLNRKPTKEEPEQELNVDITESLKETPWLREPKQEPHVDSKGNLKETLRKVGPKQELNVELNASLKETWRKEKPKSEPKPELKDCLKEESLREDVKSAPDPPAIVAISKGSMGFLLKHTLALKRGISVYWPKEKPESENIISSTHASLLQTTAFLEKMTRNPPSSLPEDTRALLRTANKKCKLALKPCLEAIRVVTIAKDKLEQAQAEISGLEENPEIKDILAHKDPEEAIAAYVKANGL